MDYGCNSALTDKMTDFSDIWNSTPIQAKLEVSARSCFDDR